MQNDDSRCDETWIKHKMVIIDASEMEYKGKKQHVN